MEFIEINFFQIVSHFLISCFKMSGVVGIDIGSADSIVASVGRGMVDIVRNEVSERTTPSVVAFTHRNRLLGDAAMSMIKSNYSNTCRFPKLLLGKHLSDSDMADETFFQLCPLKEAQDGTVGYSVNYMDKDCVFSAAEITSMLLTKLRDTTENFTGAVPRDAVIACPSYFTDIQRKCLLDAAEIAGIKPLKIMNDTAATALGYGIYRSAEFDEKIPVNVAFVSMGHSHFSCTIAQFTRHSLQVLAEITDRTVGGRNLDRLLMEHFAADFAKKNNGLDPLANVKSRYKIEEAVTKMKKILSANSEAAISIECLLDEKDMSAVVRRPDLEEMCLPLVPKMQAVVVAALHAAGLASSDIVNVEIVGGCSRIPFVQQAVSDAFGGKELSRTLNADECVARGCALQAAILSPLFKVREFGVTDYTHHPISFSWDQTETVEIADAEEGHVATTGKKSVVVFPRKSPMNVTKVLTFHRKGPFDVTAEYADAAMLPVGTSPLLGKYHFAVPSGSENKKIKVRAKLTLHGTLSIDSACIVEMEEYDEITREKVVQEEKKEDKKDKKKKSDGDVTMAAPTDEFVEVITKKHREKRVPIHFTATGVAGMEPARLAAALDAESRMISIDREARDRDNARNDLESYIYNTRERLSDEWAGYVASDEEKNMLLAELAKGEDWLYDKFDDGVKVEFAEKLVEIQSVLKVVKDRVDAVIRAQEEAEAAEQARLEAIRVERERLEAEARETQRVAEEAAAAADVNMESTPSVETMD